MAGASVDQPVNDFVPRDYQIELFEEALRENTIIFLPTGCGKTYIATMVIKHKSKDIEKTYSQGGKRSFFLVCTVALAEQQAEAIRKHVPLNVKTYTGDMGVDYWKLDRWLKELEETQVMVMTAQIFLDMLRHSYISFSRVNLIVMDECHHAVNKHAMRQIMELYNSVPNIQRPKILGLTATLLNSNVKLEKLGEEIHNLEVTFHARICRAKNESMIKEFATKPREKVIYFYRVGTDAYVNYIETNISGLISVVRDICPEEEYERPVIMPDGTTLIIDKKSETQKVINKLNEIMELATDIGSFAASYALLALLFYMERLKISCSDKSLYLLYCMVTTTIHKVRKVLRIHFQKSDNRAYDFSTPKLRELLDQVKKFEGNKSAIIFVQRRITAQVLYYVFRFLASHNEDFKEVRPDFIVGCNASPLTREPELIRKKNKETMKSFNSKETNVLVASDVVEEGIDISHCNYVIRFDLPKSFCSYIQSKGRARHETSEYHIFAPHHEAKRHFSQTYQQYKLAEKELINILCDGKDRKRPGATEREAALSLKSNIPPFYVAGPNSAVVTIDSAISLLNRYCSMLPTDKFTKLTLTWWKKELPRQFIVYLQLPMNSPLRGTIESIPCDTIDVAKACAALEACKKLYYLKELNEKLLPFGSEFSVDEKHVFPLWVESDDVVIDGSERKSRAGTKKCVRVYDQKIPHWLSACTPKPNVKTFIHVMKVTPVYDCPNTNRHKTFYNLLSSSKNFALLTSKNWPKVCSFPMFMNVGEVNIEIKENYSVMTFDADELKEIFDFHCLIVTEALTMNRRYLVKDLEDGDNSYYIAPVKEKNHRYEIDWKTIKKHKSIPQAKCIPPDSRSNISVTHDKYFGKVVIPWYRQPGYMLRYIVTKVCDDLTPRSRFPSDNFTSYSHYFSSRYEQEINNLHQPLIEVRAISQKNNCILPRERLRLGKRKKRDEEDMEEVLVPELCLLIDFPAVYLLKATLVPSVMHRLSLLFLAEELRIKIASEVGLGKVLLPSDFNFEPVRIDEAAVKGEEDLHHLKSTIEVSNLVASELQSLNPSECPWDKIDEPCDIDRNLESVDLVSIIYYDKFVKMELEEQKCHSLEQSRSEVVHVPEISYFNCNLNSEGLQLSQLMQVLISSTGNDIVNYERLETLGDSFLKFMSCLVLFTVFPEKDEGKLTNLKGKIVGNRNLFYSGRHINLGSILKVNPFVPDDWDVPHYKLLEVIKNLLKESKLSPTVLAYLNLSDEERETSLLKDESLDHLLSLLCDNDGSQSNPHILHQEAVPDKAIADSVEALIGIYFKVFGIEGAFKLCKWLQIIPDDWADINKILYVPAPSAHINKSITVDDFLVNPSNLESKLGYKFKDSSFLLQALSHPSFSQFATDCYQRLEFLGDAILDFLITCFIFENFGKLGPGEVTDLRSALVNNVTFACLAVRYGFHKFLLSKNLPLDRLIVKFADQQEKRHHKVGAEVLLMVNENDVSVGEMMDVPKVLGDVFESLAGAVYLDSGKSLQTVWKVFYRLMHNEINEFSKNVPKNSIRLLHEKFPNPKPLFESLEGWKADKNGPLIKLTTHQNGEKKIFYGFGDNKSSAKMAAAKLALRHYHENAQNSP